MKLPLRVTVLTVLLSLVILTVAGLGYSSYRNACFTSEHLATRILEEASLRIDLQINGLLRTANKQGNLNARLLSAGLFDTRSRETLAAYWLEVMRVHPN